MTSSLQPFIFIVLVVLFQLNLPALSQLTDFRLGIVVDSAVRSFHSSNFPNNLEIDARQFCADYGYANNSTCYQTLVDYVTLLKEAHFNYNIRYEDMNPQTLSTPSDEVLGRVLYSKHLIPGDSHYRAFVGPGSNYGALAGSQFALLFFSGLREDHRILDIGCGSLRLGRLLIPFLDPTNYVCTEPNEWLVAAGFRYELGVSITNIKGPQFSKTTEFSDPKMGIFNFLIAQSIFSHTSPGLLRKAFNNLALNMGEFSILLATFVIGEPSVPFDSLDSSPEQWIYPHNVYFDEKSIAYLAKYYGGLHSLRLSWRHPNQVWFAFCKSASALEVLKRRIPIEPVEPWQAIENKITIGGVLVNSMTQSIHFEFTVTDDLNAKIAEACADLMSYVDIEESLEDRKIRAESCALFMQMKAEDQLIRAGYAQHYTLSEAPMHQLKSFGAPLEVISAPKLFRLAEESSQAFASATPFPNIYFDGLFPENLLKSCAREFPTHKLGDPLTPGWGERLQFPQQFRKRYLNTEVLMGPNCKQIISFMKSSVFLKFLERLTGISGLLADPHFEGGGLHQTQSGGMLKIHQDFNFSSRLGLWRRVNVFIFLNEEPEWRDESRYNFGGHLELWDSEIQTLGAKIAPIINRLLIMQSTGNFHGHPDPLRTPDNISRKSIALYYYTARSPQPEPPKLNTIFKPRPGERF